MGCRRKNQANKVTPAPATFNFANFAVSDLRDHVQGRVYKLGEAKTPQLGCHIFSIFILFKRLINDNTEELMRMQCTYLECLYKFCVGL